MFYGVDGCQGGWVYVGLSHDKPSCFGVFKNLTELWSDLQSDAERIFIDMPIGLPQNAPRPVDSAAREVLGKRRSSIFPIPIRAAIEYGAQHHFSDEAYKIACTINADIIGKKFSKQTWNILPKVHALDMFMREHPHAPFVESHPEVVFWALNNRHPMRYSKKTAFGGYERLTMLTTFRHSAPTLATEIYDHASRLMNDDDAIDALALAVAALHTNHATLPPSPSVDTQNLPMQIVYPVIG